MAYEAYITSSYYSGTYKGAAIDASDFDRIALRASDEIDALTFGRIRSAGLTSFDDDTQEAVMLAVCVMAEALYKIDDMTDGTGIAASSEKVGSFSYTVESGSLTAVRAEAVVRARSFLLNTGLLYAGI